MLAQDRYRRHRLRLPDYLLALALVVGQATLLLGTMDMGFTRDEGFYFHAAEAYLGWFQELEDNRALGQLSESFTQENIDRHWEANPEHPVLMKALFGLSWDALAVKRGWLSPATGMRFPAVMVSALLMGLMFLFFVEAFGSRGGALFACASLVLMPRYFFHAHLACFDSPMTTAWFAVCYGYWKSYHSRTWAVLTGVLFGLAVSIKLNGFFIPFTLLLHWAVAGRRDFAWVGNGVRRRLRIPKIPTAFVSMALLGPLMFYLLWPYHWFDTFNRITWYFGRHLSHEHYYVNFFGEALVRPPFPVSYPFVMTLLTVPLVTLATAAVGGSSLLREAFARGRRSGNEADSPDRRGTGALVVINLLIPIGIIALPSTPVFGGTKHWMQAMPFLAVLSGIGAMTAFNLLWQQTGSTRAQVVRGAAMAGFGLLLLAPAATATMNVHPHGTTYYNELIGGVRGAADAEMMRQFWGYATRDGLDYLNEHAPNRARVHPHNAQAQAWEWYVRDGLLRDDIVAVWEPERADYSFFNHQKAFVSSFAPPSLIRVWDGAGTSAPVRVWTVHGVPVLSLYARAGFR